VYYTDEYRHEQFLALVLNELRLRHVPFGPRGSPARLALLL
jgi:hypothetical protein